MAPSKGINRYDEKFRREQRRRNRIARDLASSKYHQRVVPSARRIKQIDEGVFYEDVRYDEIDE